MSKAGITNMTSRNSAATVGADQNQNQTNKQGRASAAEARRPPSLADTMALATRISTKAIAGAMSMIRSHFNAYDLDGAWERVPLAERRELFVLAGLEDSPLFDMHWEHLPDGHQLAIRRALFAVAGHILNVFPGKAGAV